MARTKHKKPRAAAIQAPPAPPAPSPEEQSLRSFEVFGLFGRADLDVSIRLNNNRLVLVGENGTGKSTLVNIMYYCLTRQWARLVELPFAMLRAVFDTTTVEVDREKLKRDLLSAPGDMDMLHYLRRRYGPHTADRMYRELMHADSSRPEFERQLFLSHELGIESQVWREYVAHRSRARPSYVSGLDTAIKHAISCQILFLPTYRRIERDLQAIFPRMSAERDLKSFHRSTPSDAAYVELVEFGMRDVADVIKETMQALDRDFRQDLVRLTSLYLRDVIRGDYNHDQFEPLMSEATADALPALLTRVDDKILPSDDRQSLSELVGRIQASRVVPQESRVAAHFLVRLVEAHALQSKREAPVRGFAAVCNGYLSGKQIVFDSAQFELFVCRTGDDGQPILHQKIPVEGLSSGEKQIVSLFAHMYLSGQARYYVIIDEPELSISVVWQRKFLEDIIGTGMCAGLVAVTHSPFTFDNSLADFAHSVSEFLVRPSVNDVVS